MSAAKVLVFFCLFSLLGISTVSLGCSGACTVDADCAANACRYCDTDYGRCADCCEFVDNVTCPSACTWDAGSSECRNEAATECGVIVPEVPSDFPRFFWIGLSSVVILLAGLGTWLHRRQKAS